MIKYEDITTFNVTGPGEYTTRGGAQDAWIS